MLSGKYTGFVRTEHCREGKSVNITPSNPNASPHRLSEVGIKANVLVHAIVGSDAHPNRSSFTQRRFLAKSLDKLAILNGI